MKHWTEFLPEAAESSSLHYDSNRCLKLGHEVKKLEAQLAHLKTQLTYHEQDLHVRVVAEWSQDEINEAMRKAHDNNSTL